MQTKIAAKKSCFYYKFAKTPKKMGLMTFLKFKMVRFPEKLLDIYLRSNMKSRHSIKS